MFGIDDAIIGSMLTGGASLLGNVFGANQSAENSANNIQAQIYGQQMSQQFNATQADLSRQFNREEAAVNRQFLGESADANRQFQLQMSNSAHQRAMADMRAAGLNPILAAGQQASQPSGAMAGGSAASGPAASSSAPNLAHANTRSALEGLGDAVGKSVQSAIQMKLFDKMTEEIANIQADTAKTKASEALTKQQTATEVNETRRRSSEAEKSAWQILREQLSANEANAILSMPKWLRDSLVQSAYTGGKVGQTLDAVPILGSAAKTVRDILPKRTTIERSTTDTRGHGSSSFEERFYGYR